MTNITPIRNRSKHSQMMCLNTLLEEAVITGYRNRSEPIRDGGDFLRCNFLIILSDMQGILQEVPYHTEDEEKQKHGMCEGEEGAW